MKVLLAGPGTGKTTKIASLIKEKPDAQKVLILSFTNATVEDLKKDLKPSGVTGDNCMTLHKFAVKYNHDKYRHVLNNLETAKLSYIATKVGVSFDHFCDFLACTTFGQMIVRFVGYAKSNPTYLRDKLSNFTTLIVDEYQDFNPDEQALIDLLIEQIADTYILGDDDQCIYDFKDASTDKIIELHNTYDTIPHEHKCFRCPDNVVHHSTNLIKNNTKRVDKKWEKTGKPGNVIYKQFLTSDEVADYVLSEVQKVAADASREKILILSPVEFTTREVVTKLDAAGIDYTNFFVPPVPTELIHSSWKLRSLFGDYKYLNLLLLGYTVLSTRTKFYELIKKHVEEGQNFDELYRLVEGKLPGEVTTPYTNLDEALPVFTDIAVLYAAAEGDSENEKLENLFRVIEERPEKNIKLMSIHKSKGLGSEHVFMLGLTEGIIPNKKTGTDSIESQRRLFYVGMTRAKKNLHLLSAVRILGKFVFTVNKADFKFNRTTRTYDGRASSFIGELGL